MVFAHDTEVALAAAAALVNTEENGGLDSVAELAGFVSHWGWTGRHRRTAIELEQVQALRPRLRGVWNAGRDEAVAITNELLREFRALPQLVAHDDWDYHLHATDADAPLAARMAVEAAMAFVDVIRMDELERLRVCVADDCESVLVDLSKNRSRRYCEFGCGNKANVAAYRARQRSR
ncbi:CGNR zinc finger domain-containing protein [Jatrophihabitans fulvus]